ncbi:MAG: Asp-tRNA(Asn)/Glu-tRNA(Gln) amidotransferase GatCAB subunit B, partial [Candidatus Dadabacteria bacterium]
KIAKAVFDDIWETGKDPEVIVKEKGLKQITDPEELEAVVKQVLQENSKQVEEFKSGNQKVLGFLVGQVMKKTAGSANPRLANEILKAELEKDAD